MLHLLENSSDHCPIYCKIAVNFVPKVNVSEVAQVKPKPSWRNASNAEKELFTNILREDLESIKKPEFICEDVHCKNPAHLNAADDYLDKIVSKIEYVCETAIPTAKVKTDGKKLLQRKLLVGIVK